MNEPTPVWAKLKRHKAGVTIYFGNWPWSPRVHVKSNEQAQQILAILSIGQHPGQLLMAKLKRKGLWRLIK